MSKVIKNLLGFPFSSRQGRLARERQALSETEFVQRIVGQGGDALAAAALWRRLKEWTCVNDFTPYPTDSLGSVFGIAEEELDEDLLLGILRELGLSTPSNELLSEFGVVDTPLRVAQLVAQCRRPPVTSPRTN
jgi:hypothetical protein